MKYAKIYFAGEFFFKASASIIRYVNWKSASISELYDKAEVKECHTPRGA